MSRRANTGGQKGGGNINMTSPDLGPGPEVEASTWHLVVTVDKSPVVVPNAMGNLSARLNNGDMEQVWDGLKKKMLEIVDPGGSHGVVMTNDSVITAPIKEGGLGADSLDTVELIMAIEEKLTEVVSQDEELSRIFTTEEGKVDVTLSDAEVVYVGRVMHVGHIFNVKIAESDHSGITKAWMEKREKEMAEYKKVKEKMKAEKADELL